jgi:hypothetical protein
LIIANETISNNVNNNNEQQNIMPWDVDSLIGGSLLVVQLNFILFF